MDDEQLARRVLRDTLTATDATPADRVRAAQLLLAHGAAPGATGDALAASDAELLRIARGQEPGALRSAQGDSPPLMGPAVPGEFSVPCEAQDDVPRGTATRSEERATRNEPIATRSEEKATRPGPAVPADPFGRVPAAFLAKGPKKGPVDSGTPGGTSQNGTQKGPANLTSPPGHTQNGTSIEANPWE